MEAMILAAGAGTRLRPITDRIPKALVPVRGRPLLSHVLDRLVAAGATRVVVNVCHHADQIAAYVERHARPGVEVVLSPEPDGPYETGGGLLAAAPLFARAGPILVHNVDVISRIPLERLLAEHERARERAAGRLVATLAVQDRGSRRRLVFDAEGLTGWEERANDGAVRDEVRAREPRGPLTRWSYTGIHVVEPAVFGLPHPAGRFSVVTWYLGLSARDYRVVPVDVTADEWFEVGTPERLAQAEERAE